MSRRSGAFLRGVEQFNRAEFFDAHETWETLWLRASGPDKVFLQATIQLAAAFHHWESGNPQGTLSLLRRGMDKLARFPHSYWGIRVDRLRGEAERWALALGDDPVDGKPPLPKIELETTPPIRP